jgi:hypothetical protein
MQIAHGLSLIINRSLTVSEARCLAGFLLENVELH